ncbi:MAG: hypothetical protein MK132_17755 [Lentisphaerales bacterium]|nr:hypothetical protein [Lentisphaerales bacterium]
MLKYKIALFFVSLLTVIVAVPRFGDGSYINVMLLTFISLHLLFIKSKVQFSLPPIIPLLLTAAFAYVLFCETCSALKKSIIFTMWLSYLSALVSNGIAVSNNR